MTPFRVDCLALCDIEAARRYYDGRLDGLGQRFASAVADTIERIAENPLIHQRVWREFRKCRVLRFPYGVLYRFDGKIVDILVAVDLRRRPGYWKPRVEPD